MIEDLLHFNCCKFLTNTDIWELRSACDCGGATWPWCCVRSDFNPLLGPKRPGWLCFHLSWAYLCWKEKMINCTLSYVNICFHTSFQSCVVRKCVCYFGWKVVFSFIIYMQAI